MRVDAMDSALFGVDMLGHSMREAVLSPVAQRFLISPFTTFDSGDEIWQERKRAWILAGAGSSNGKATADPVIAELIYLWFSRAGAQVLDPFSGFGVRGIVAAHLSRKYWGCDIQADRIAKSKEACAALAGELPEPAWIWGDIAQVAQYAPAADLLFVCPPAGCQEQHSEALPSMSRMSHADFLPAFQSVVKACCQRLRDNRFACAIVEDFRDEAGNLRNLVAETVSAFLAAGLRLYNEAILITGAAPAASEPQGALCRNHKNILVFVKGNGRAAADWCTAE